MTFVYNDMRKKLLFIFILFSFLSVTLVTGTLSVPCMFKSKTMTASSGKYDISTGLSGPITIGFEVSANGDCVSPYYIKYEKADGKQKVEQFRDTYSGKTSLIFAAIGPGGSQGAPLGAVLRGTIGPTDKSDEAGFYALSEGGFASVSDSCGGAAVAEAKTCLHDGSDKAKAKCDEEHPKIKEQNAKAETKSGMYIAPAGVKWLQNFGKNNIKDIVLEIPNEYKTETEKNRKFTPETFTPFDDLRVKLFVERSCGWGYNYYAKLFTYDSNDNEVEIVRSKDMKLLEEFGGSATGKTYALDFNAWPNGITTYGLNLEFITESIAKDRRIFIRVYVEKKIPPHYLKDEEVIAIYSPEDRAEARFVDAEVVTEFVAERDVKMSNCVQVYGSGEHSFVMMQGSSSMAFLGSLRKIIDFSYNSLVKSFITTDPFKEYNDKLSFFVDLYEHEDKNFERYESNGRKYYFMPNVGINVPKISNCKNKEKYFFDNTLTFMGYTFIGSKTMFLDYDKLSERKKDISIVYVHETGHSLCKLDDEYVSSDRTISKSNYMDVVSIFGSLTNCAIDPKISYRLNDFLYGETSNSGCTFLKYSISNKIENLVGDYNRPSDNSIMRIEQQNKKFNVVSCGYCVAALKGERAKSAKNYWPYCMKLDTIKLDCTKSSCPNGFVCNAETKLCKKA